MSDAADLMEEALRLAEQSIAQYRVDNAHSEAVIAVARRDAAVAQQRLRIAGKVNVVGLAHKARMKAIIEARRKVIEQVEPDGPTRRAMLDMLRDLKTEIEEEWLEGRPGT